MKTSVHKTTIQIANDAINSWLKDTTKLVVAIDGYTGVGKTTFLANLARLNSDILPINCDDFLLPRRTVEQLFKNAHDKSKIFELEVCDNKKIKNLVTAFRDKKTIYHTQVYDPISGEVNISKDFNLSKKVLIIEGVFMYHPKLLNHLWDKRIYLDGDMAEIDKRRIAREQQRWGKDYFPETHPDSYFAQVIIALKRYRTLYKPDQTADLILHI